MRKEKKEMIKTTVIAKGPVCRDSTKQYYLLETIYWGEKGEDTIGGLPLGAWAKDYLGKILIISLIENVPPNE